MNPDTTYCKAALYCRLSEEDRDKLSPGQDSLSIQNQKSILCQYAQEHQWEIYDIYSDDDYAGADRKRPEFNRLIRDAQDGKFQIILCKTQSRFTRELELVEKYIHHLFPIWGIRFVSIVDNADTAEKGNKKSRQINGLINEWYLEDMSENIRSVLDNRRKNGFHIGSFALYGYKKDPQNHGHLIIDEEAAVVVREIFSLYAQGFGKAAIARILNTRGIPNPSEYKRLQGLHYHQPENRRGTLWSSSSIAGLLTNECYIGNLIQGKYGSISYKTKENRPRPKEKWFRAEGTHDPIIDKELWDSVQKLIRQKSRPYANGKIGVFAEKVHCASCGRTMRSMKHKSGRHYLKCPLRSLSKDACPGSFISVEKLEKAVLEQLASLSLSCLDREFLAKSISAQESAECRRQLLKKEISSWTEKLEEASACLKESYCDKVKGLLTESDFLELSKEFSRERELLSQHLLSSRKKLESMEQNDSASEDSVNLLETYLHPAQLNRLLLDTMIRDIRIKKKDPATNSVSVEIHWNFENPSAASGDPN